MIKINDEMLLKEVIGFCDSLIEENVLKKYTKVGFKRRIIDFIKKFIP